MVFSKPPVCGHESLDVDSVFERVRLKRGDPDSRQQVVGDVSQGAAMEPRRVRKGRKGCRRAGGERERGSQRARWVSPRLPWLLEHSNRWISV